MTAIKGTNVAAPVVPFDTDDIYATHDEQYGKGGFRTVATTTARDAVPAERRTAGMLVYVVATTTTYQLAADLTTWNAYSPGSSSTIPYDIGFFFPDQPDANEFILELLMVRAVTFVSGLTGSKFAIKTNPTSTMTFTILKNGSSIGTVAFNTSGSPTVTFTTTTAFASGDLFGIQAPSPQDATGAGISFTFIGSI